MAQYEGDDRALLEDKRKVVVQGKRYHWQTTYGCTTCSQPDRMLYLKQKIGEDYMLECPFCETVVPQKGVEVEYLRREADARLAKTKAGQDE